MNARLIVGIVVLIGGLVATTPARAQVAISEDGVTFPDGDKQTAAVILPMNCPHGDSIVWDTNAESWACETDLTQEAVCPSAAPPECTGGCLDGTCYIDCPNGVCDGAVIQCPSVLNCEVDYEGNGGQTTIFCPDGYACTLNCSPSVQEPPTLECGTSTDCTNNCSAAPIQVTSGIFAVQPSPVYSCTAGGIPVIDFSITEFVFSVSGSTITISGAPSAMIGSVNHPNFEASHTSPGNVVVTYILAGSFINADQWEGTFAIDITDSIGVSNCQDSEWVVLGTRQ